MGVWQFAQGVISSFPFSSEFNVKCDEAKSKKTLTFACQSARCQHNSGGVKHPVAEQARPNCRTRPNLLKGKDENVNCSCGRSSLQQSVRAVSSWRTAGPLHSQLLTTSCHLQCDTHTVHGLNVSEADTPPPPVHKTGRFTAFGYFNTRINMDRITSSEPSAPPPLTGWKPEKERNNCRMLQPTNGH